MKFDPIGHVLGEHQIELPPDTDLWAVGDVHGCIDEYMQLREEIKRLSNGRGFRIVQLGDMIDRGPSFADIILEDYAHYRVMGNHEHNFIAEHLGLKECRSKARNENHEVFASLSDKKKEAVLEALRTRKSHFVYKSGRTKFIFSHAPYSKIRGGWDGVAAVSSTNISDWAMGSIAVNLEETAKLDQYVTYIHGHQSWHYKNIEDQIDEQRNHKTKVFNLDSSCVYGRELIALRISDFCIARVKSNVNVDEKR